MPVKFKTVNCSISFIFYHGILGKPYVCNLKRLEKTVRKDNPLSGKEPENRLANVHRHPHQSLLCIVCREYLMLVLIVISYINLAYPACGIIPEDLG